ncbi:MAG: hypothetical protein ACI959_000320 [Limisphaerales bacterium]|jgi:uncharacterized protein YfaS (alpha-2-macroglobulin family)
MKSAPLRSQAASSLNLYLKLLLSKAAIQVPTLLLLSLFFLFSCSSNKEYSGLKISGTSNEHEFSPKENPVFYFSESLAPDSVRMKWQETKYLTWEPEIEGIYRWTSSTTLEFSPLEPLPPGTDFRITPTEELLKYTKEKKPIAADGYWDAHTPDLNLRFAQLYWYLPDNASEPAIRSDIHFNYDVETALAHEMLEVKVNGKIVNSILREDGSAPILKIELEQIEELEEADIVIGFKAGLKPRAGNRKSEKRFEWKSVIPSKERLEVRSMEANHNGTEGVVQVIYSQQVKTEEIESYVSISPKIKFEIEESTNGFKLLSDEFSLDRTYKIKIKKGLKSTIGGTLKSEYEKSFTFGKLEPEINFTDNQSQYLGSKGARNIAVRIISIPKVKVTISKVFENNLLQFAKDGTDYHWDYSDDGDYHNYRSYSLSGKGEVVSEKEYETEKLPKNGESRLLHIDFEDQFNKYEGIYIVTVASTEKGWLQESKIISLSDIGLMAKSASDQVFVFANSIQSANPISGLEVNFFSDHNQLMYTSTTDINGVAIFDRVDQETESFRMGMITAKKGEDYNYLNFSQTGINSSRFPVGGAYFSDKNYDAYLYGERDLYRPGETLNMAAIVRNLDQSSPGSVPVKIRIIQPSGREWKNIRHTLDEQGSTSVSLDLPSSVPTGRWVAELYTSNDLMLGSFRFSVEEFVPDRIRLNGTVDKEVLQHGESFTASIQALNFYGPPAANRNYQAEFRLKGSPISSEALTSWNFSVSGNNNLSLQAKEGKTTEEGIAEVTFEIPVAYENMGRLKGSVLTTVFDETGRPVYNVKEVLVHTQDYYFGLGPFDYYNSTKSILEIPIAVVDKEGALTNGKKAQIEIIRYEWESGLVRRGSGYRYRSNRVERVIIDEEVDLNGKNTYAFSPRLSGKYSIRIKKPGTKHYVEKSFYAYGWGNTDPRSFEVDREGRIEIVASSSEVEAGDEVDFLFKTPFDGKLLVTIEREKVYEYKYIDTDNKSASLKFKMPKEYVPTAYVSATLIRPHEGSTLPLTVAHGFLPVRIEKSMNKMAVEITAVTNSRSARTQEITIKTKPNAMLTIAAVDQGILQITNFEDPDPYEWFFRKRALEVESFDLYAKLFPELINISGLSGGGDGDDQLNKRLNPIDAQRFKMMSEWSGIIQANAKGIAKWTLVLPRFSGEVHIMAAAWKDDVYGASATSMTVADPLVVTTSLPRFMSPNDKIAVPIMLANTTDKNTNGKITIRHSSLTEVIGQETIEFEALAGKETQVQFTLLANKAVGAETITIEATAFGETFTEEIQIPIRPASPLQKVTDAGFANAGESKSISLNAGYLDLLTGGKFVVSRSPLTQFSDDLEYLVRYPHGCVEQTVSKAFPQLYFSDMIKLIGLEEEEEFNSIYNVEQAILKLQGMQMHHGGLSYWPGSGYDSWWGTAYACHFLYESKQAGFQVDERTLKNMKNYLRNKIKQKNTFVYRYNRISNASREVAVKETAYSLYVLALMGDPDLSMMNYYRSNSDLLALDGKYLLAASFGLAGDRKQFDVLIPGGFAGEDPEPAFGGSFYSGLRDQALALNAILSVDPDHHQVAEMAKYIADQLKGRRYCNTQERAFGFLALGKISAAKNLGNGTATVTSGGKIIGEFKGKDLVISKDDLIDDKLEIMPTGDGSIYYYWEVEGVSTQGKYKEEDKFLKVRKTFYDRYGNSMNEAALKNIKQNDLLVVGITIQGPYGATIENVAITDILPAGFEIENKRLREVPDMDWIKDNTEPEYFDIRDDRISFFNSVRYSYSNYYYVVRAVSAGEFVMGPVAAEAMYNAEYHSYHGAGEIKISAK